MMTLAQTRHDGNTADEFYSAEQDYYDEMSPRYSNMVIEYQKLLVRFSVPQGAWRKRSGRWPLKIWSFPAIHAGEADPAGTGGKRAGDRLREASGRGEDRLGRRDAEPVSAAPLPEKSDREIRRKAWKKFSAFFQENEKELDDLYDKLVKNRTKQAKELGYENYVELGYYRMNRNCYDKAQVEAFRSQVKKDFVALCGKSCMKNAGNVWDLRSFPISTRAFTLRREIPIPRERRRRSWRPDSGCMRSCLWRRRNFLIS